MGRGDRRRNEEKNDHGSIHPQSKELWCVPKAGLTVAVDSGHWQGRGGINSERRKGREWGKTAQPSPAQLPSSSPGPRAQDPSDACCTAGVQAGSQSARPSQAGRQAGRRCRFAMRERPSEIGEDWHSTHRLAGRTVMHLGPFVIRQAGQGY